MFHDVIHTWIITIGQTTLQLGIGPGRVPRSRENPFGFSGKLYFISYIATVIMLSAGSLYALLDGIASLTQPVNHPLPNWMVLLVFLSVVITVFILFTIYRVITRLRGAISFFSFIRKSKRVDLVTAMIQESALFCSLLVSVFSLFFKYFSNWALADGIGTIAIGLIMLVGSFITGIKMQDLLIGESAELSLNKQIFRLLVAEEWISEVVSLQTMQLDNFSILLAVKAQFKEHLNSTEINTLTNGIEQDIRKAYPEIKRIFFETAQHQVRL